MTHSVRSLRRGRFEALEQRHLLAGDVLVNVVGGNLVIEGDELDNKIMITSGEEAGTFVVTGLDGTTVHEEGATPGSEVAVTDVRSALVSLGDGNDLVAVVGAAFDGHLGINTGAGDDRALVGTGGDAPELVGLLPEDLSVEVAWLLHINTDGGNDLVSVDDATGGFIGIHAGEDDDMVSLGSTAPLEGEATARLTSHGLVVNLSAGNDELTFDQVGVRGVIIANGGEGDDTVNASALTSAVFAVLGDGGNDMVTLADLDVYHLGIHTGDGDDNVDIRDSVFTSLGVSLGDGTDTLTTAALEARIAVLSGGEGEDTLEVVSANNFAHEVIKEFEIPPDVNTSLPWFRQILGRLLQLFR